jgi:glycosyltransferase involved in cell wall biosynthesis
MPTVTVFTPTFNRGNLLHRVYESLCAQTYKDFEWLIIDDGSSDNTRDVVWNFAKISPFPIRYYYHENQGKALSINKGLSLVTIGASKKL